MRGLIAALFLLLAGPASAGSVGFAATTAVFDNPERGFWREANGDLLAATADDLAYAAEVGRLVYAPVRLDAYRDADLPPAFLDRLGAKLALLRSQGLKLILRFAYNDGMTDGLGLDAPEAQVLRHIAQVKPVVAANADVVFVWEMGFIGAWGEGHTSEHGLDSAAAKTAIGDALLAALPPNRRLMWRTPADVRRWYPAGSLGPAPRIGMFNDCFLASTTDVGTYAEEADTRAAEQAYVAALTAGAPFGGETCAYDADSVGERTSCAAILAEGQRFHLTFLGRDFYAAFHDGWKAGGCLDDVERLMGYRLTLRTASAPDSVERGATASVRVTLANVGWAAPVNARRLDLRVRADDGTLVATLEGDDLTSLGAGVSRGQRFDWKVPKELAPGRYLLAVAAPDAAAGLEANPAYAVRFANANRDVGLLAQGWDAARGEFALGLAVRVE